MTAGQGANLLSAPRRRRGRIRRRSSASRHGWRCREAAEDAPARFEHAPKASLPMLEGGDAAADPGTAHGERAPVTSSSSSMPCPAPGRRAQVHCPDDHRGSRGPVAQGLGRDRRPALEASQMMVFRPGDRLALAGPRGARLLLLGGGRPRGPQHVWWNCRLVPGADRGGQGGLGQRRFHPWTVPPAAGRRSGVHPLPLIAHAREW